MAAKRSPGISRYCTTGYKKQAIYSLNCDTLGTESILVKDNLFGINPRFSTGKTNQVL